MRGLIISSGTITDYSRLESVVRESDFIISADGGMDHMMKIGRLPDLLLGDLDSISQDALKYIEEKNIPIQKFPSIKDGTDTDLAMEYLIEKNVDEIIFAGVTGSRQDHTMANIFLLNRLKEKGIKGKIVDDNNTIYLVDDYLELEYIENSFISIIPITEDGIEVTLEGFFYNLDKRKIKFGSTCGVSNIMVESHGKIKIHSGKALVFIAKD